MKPRTHETRTETKRHYHRVYIGIALNTYRNTLLTKGRLPTLRETIAEVKRIEQDWFFSERLPEMIADDSYWDANGNYIEQCPTR